MFSFAFILEQTACCYMFIEGNPAPTFKFFKGGSEITEGGRYKLISDGENNNMIMLTIAKVKATDEAEYRVYIENCHGSDEKTFMLYVSGKYPDITNLICTKIFSVVYILSLYDACGKLFSKKNY